MEKKNTLGKIMVDEEKLTIGLPQRTNRADDLSDNGNNRHLEN
jgi:hypothetical protein